MSTNDGGDSAARNSLSARVSTHHIPDVIVVDRLLLGQACAQSGVGVDGDRLCLVAEERVDRRAQAAADAKERKRAHKAHLTRHRPWQMEMEAM